MKAGSLRARIARLDALIPADPEQFCCLDAVYLELLRPHFDAMSAYVDRTPGELPLEPPVLPSGGLCRRTGAELCPAALDHARAVWTRYRQLAINTAGLTEADLE